MHHRKQNAENYDSSRSAQHKETTACDYFTHLLDNLNKLSKTIIEEVCRILKVLQVSDF